MSKEIADYNPSAPGQKGSLFGLPHTREDAEVVIYPVTWEATVSYNSGTAFGPTAILEASAQLDLELPNQESPWKRGIWMSTLNGKTKAKSDLLRSQIKPYIDSLEGGKEFEGADELLEKANKATESLRLRIFEETLDYIKEGKKVGLLGGDHSCPLGFIDALSTQYADFGILQIDAHMDLREAYEGFTHSHASIMYNALKNPQVSKLVQVGIRDYCDEELDYVNEQGGRVSVFYDEEVKNQLFAGESWKSIVQAIIGQLPQQVYISFDIDGLQPFLCPGTGTPVPGGLNFDQAIYLLTAVKESGREIIGFDLCEVAPLANDREWNANVGARLLYRLCGLIG
ncbi:agmatinase family protein [Reichenbachiella ulvae]|uniref:Agmatinase family protein n=1 Tax=Reichenbachiella ulvae TaxID=2980104 RepID=A0ABT3CTB3_9BACT|nr:agmatinase family protein [Reichenbachiella ulvae]MCV9386764.1 agmatinase family protein [Reichenbachiella ulvae]